MDPVTAEVPWRIEEQFIELWSDVRVFAAFAVVGNVSAEFECRTSKSYKPSAVSTKVPATFIRSEPALLDIAGCVYVPPSADPSYIVDAAPHEKLVAGYPVAFRPNISSLSL